MLADDRENLARFVIGRSERHPVGIAGLRPMVVGIVAERGSCSSWLLEGREQVDRVVAVRGGASYRGERGQIAYGIEARGDDRATG